MPAGCSLLLTNITLTKYKYRGLVTFISDEWENEYMHLFTATEYEGDIKECDEGELVWVPKSDLEKLKLWEGDKIFFKLLEEEERFFTLKLTYKGEELVGVETMKY